VLANLRPRLVTAKAAHDRARAELAELDREVQALAHQVADARERVGAQP
jgi:hypothetical protein